MAGAGSCAAQLQGRRRQPTRRGREVPRTSESQRERPERHILTFDRELMQYWAPPQYSDDGSWWWTAALVPVTWRSSRIPAGLSRPAPAREERPADAASSWVGLIALALPLLLRGRRRGEPDHPNLGLSAVPAAPPTEAPVPTPAPSERGAPRHGRGLSQRGDRGPTAFQDAGQAVADKCKPGAMRSAQRLPGPRSRRWTTPGERSATLEPHPAPTCLQPADRELRTALALYHQGARRSWRLQRGDRVAWCRAPAPWATRPPTPAGCNRSRPAC